MRFAKQEFAGELIGLSRCRFCNKRVPAQREIAKTVNGQRRRMASSVLKWLLRLSR